MEYIKLCDSDYRFMCVVWEHAPVNSGELVKLCQEQLGWKKSTTYTVVRKMCEKGYIANEDATKRNRSNLINWGMLPFLIPSGNLPFKNGDYLFFPGIRKAVEEKADVIKGYTVEGDALKEFDVTLGELTDDEREIILKGCLINYNRK